MEQIAIDHKGFPGYRLQTPVCSATILPAHGAHIASLYDKRLAFEWLYQPPEPQFHPSIPGACFTDGTCAGLDDMFPNALEVDCGGVHLPDHGEGWTLPYEVLRADASELLLRARGRAMAYRVEKRITLENASLRIDYTFTNETDRPLPFLFAAHPLFRAMEGDRIELDEVHNSVQMILTAGIACVPGQRYAYPIATDDQGNPLRLDRALREAGSYCKYVFSNPMRTGCCRIVSADRARAMELTFSAGLLPYLGVWTDNGACGNRPQRNVSLQPSTHNTVVLTDQGPDAAFFLPPGGQARWLLCYTMKAP